MYIVMTKGPKRGKILILCILFNILISLLMDQSEKLFRHVVRFTTLSVYLNLKKLKWKINEIKGNISILNSVTLLDSFMLKMSFVLF